MAPAKQLRLVIVTPEKTLLDETVQALRFPLFDGQIGVLPGRTPLVGRLGYGELKIRDEQQKELSYFIDGGFVQIKGSVVSLLTNRAMPADEINEEEAREYFNSVSSRTAKTDSEFATKTRDLERSRRMLALARQA